MYTTELFKLPQILSPILNLVSVNPNLHCNNCFCTLTICKYPIHSIYLDYSKAFDKVSHKILLEKLWSMGINNNLWFWLKSYLTNRFQRVKINQSLSDPLPVKSGVPHGSILGPLLFLLFINDLPTTVKHSNILSFADDTKCYKVIRNILDTTLLQSDLESVFKWSTENQLFFNIHKCTVLPFKSKSPSDANCYSIDNNIVSSKFSHRDLGIIFSTNLSWSTHYESIISKAYRSFGLLRRVFSNIHFIKAKKDLYISIVRSNLLYCSPLWRPYLIKDILNLERIQRRASKYILGDYTSDYKTRLIKLNLLPLMYIYELLDILFFIKSYKSPINSFNIFQYVTFNNSFRDKKLASNNLVNSNSYFCRISRLWNALPVIDITSSLTAIKSKLLSFLWNHFL